VQSTDPERELVRRVAPFGPPAFAVALLAGAALGGWNAGWSAAIAIAVVFANVLAHGYSLAWAGRISPSVLFAVAAGGYVIRLAAIAGILVALRTLDWFSIGAFLTALVPATIALLAFEMKVLAGKLQSELWMLPPGAQEAHR
jgi:hypothetical protein